MLPVKYTNSILSGRRTRKQIISSQFVTIVKCYRIDFPPLVTQRHALREYNIHKKLDHIVS